MYLNALAMEGMKALLQCGAEEGWMLFVSDVFRWGKSIFAGVVRLEASREEREGLQKEEA